MRIRTMLAAFGVGVLAVASGPPRAQAVVVAPETCYQTGLNAGCRYAVTYNDGMPAHEETADSEGRISRPCNKIIVAVDLLSPGGACNRVQPRSGIEC